MLAFAAALESHKITTSIRQTRGLDASAACGQLRNEFQKSPLRIDSSTSSSESDIAVASWWQMWILSNHTLDSLFPINNRAFPPPSRKMLVGEADCNTASFGMVGTHCVGCESLCLLCTGHMLGQRYEWGLLILSHWFTFSRRRMYGYHWMSEDYFSL